MKRLLLTGASAAARRARGGVWWLALAAGLSAAAVATPTPPPLPAPNSDTGYLFVPGHGLTRRTSGPPGKSLAETIAEAVAINGDPAYRVKIGFIEEAYVWKDLQPHPSPSSVNITRLAADLAAGDAKGTKAGAPPINATHPPIKTGARPGRCGPVRASPRTDRARRRCHTLPRVSVDCRAAHISAEWWQ